MTKKLRIMAWCTVISCLLYTLSQFHAAADLSVVAFPLCLVFTGGLVFCFVKVMSGSLNLSFLPALRKLNEYIPCVFMTAFIFRRAGETGTTFAYDLVTILLWIASTVSGFILLLFLSDKRLYAQNPSFAEAKEAYDREHPARKLGFGVKVLVEALGWVDALVQAVFTVVLINIFIFQLYEIPSESMVPEFLIKDRVIVFKTLSGPKFPLSDVGLPEIRTYERGDIVVFRNPHYSMDRENEVKTFVSQLVYMLSCTTVNLNVDEDGVQKSDPLVKRIVGVPGEQLMMQDGVLYHRTQGQDEFSVVEEDATWAEWNLKALPSDVRQNIRDYVISDEQYRTMLQVEDERRNLDLDALAAECRGLAARFTELRNLSHPELRLDDGADVPNLLNKYECAVEALLYRTEATTLKLSTVYGGAEWFSAFVTSWADELEAARAAGEAEINGNLYDESMFRYDAMIKACFARLVVRYAEMNYEGVTAEVRNTDSVRSACLVDAYSLTLYSLLMNGRNMPVFPANDADGNPQYIPEGNYFMMGDNRFNSLDMRHSYDEWSEAVSARDPYPVYYKSNVQPQYVSDRRILGTPNLRFMPVSRFGVPGHTATVVN